MQNPEYHRLNIDGHLVGFKRVITEYLTLAGVKWQLDPIDHEPDDSPKLSVPPVGIGSLQRAKLGK